MLGHIYQVKGSLAYAQAKNRAWCIVRVEVKRQILGSGEECEVERL